MVRAKARLVARGFKQREGIDFLESCAPTPAGSCSRLFGATSYELGSNLCNFDAEKAFVQTNLEDIFMRPPPGCETPGNKVVRLNRSLCGLKKVSR